MLIYTRTHRGGFCHPQKILVHMAPRRVPWVPARRPAKRANVAGPSGAAATLGHAARRCARQPAPRGRRPASCTFVLDIGPQLWWWGLRSVLPNTKVLAALASIAVSVDMDRPEDLFVKIVETRSCSAYELAGRSRATQMCMCAWGVEMRNAYCFWVSARDDVPDA